MDRDLDDLIRSYDRFYKKIDNMKYCRDFHMLMIPDINVAIDSYYQKKLNDKFQEMNDDEKKDKDKIEKMKDEMNEKIKDEMNIQDDYLYSIKNNFIKIKDKQYKRKQQQKENNKPIIN